VKTVSPAPENRHGDKPHSRGRGLRRDRTDRLPEREGKPIVLVGKEMGLYGSAWVNELLGRLGRVFLHQPGFNRGLLADSSVSRVQGGNGLLQSVGLHHFPTLPFGLFGATLQRLVDRGPPPPPGMM